MYVVGLPEMKCYRLQFLKELEAQTIEIIMKKVNIILIKQKYIFQQRRFIFLSYVWRNKLLRIIMKQVNKYNFNIIIIIYIADNIDLPDATKSTDLKL